MGLWKSCMVTVNLLAIHLCCYWIKIGFLIVREGNLLCYGKLFNAFSEHIPSPFGAACFNLSKKVLAKISPSLLAYFLWHLSWYLGSSILKYCCDYLDKAWSRFRLCPGKLYIAYMVGDLFIYAVINILGLPVVLLPAEMRGLGSLQGVIIIALIGFGNDVSLLRSWFWELEYIIQ